MKSLLRVVGLFVLILCVRQETAASFPSCYGDCTVSCSSGETYWYYTTSFECCGKAVCPDGGSAEWWPAYGCWDEEARICLLLT